MQVRVPPASHDPNFSSLQPLPCMIHTMVTEGHEICKYYSSTSKAHVEVLQKLIVH